MAVRKLPQRFAARDYLIILTSLLRTKLTEGTMIQSVVLIETTNADDESLRSLSLLNAKQIVIGRAPGFGTVLHVAATTVDDLTNALQKFSKVHGVKQVVTLTIRTS